MKKHLFTLLTLLLVGISSAWADDDPDYESSDWTSSTVTSVVGTHGDVIISGALGSTGNVSGHYYLPISANLKNSDDPWNGYLGISSSRKILKVSVLYCPNGSNATNLAWVAWGTGVTPNQYTLSHGTTTGTAGSKAWDSRVWEDIDLSGTNAYTIYISRSVREFREIGGSSNLSNFGNGQTINVLGIKVWLEASSKVATPTFTPNGATFTTSQSVTLACATDDSSIYYTTDGTTPSKTNGTLYSSAINLTSSTTIKAIAVDDNETLEDSEVATATFTKVISTPWNSWDFTSWSSATETGVLGDASNWDDSEKGGSGLDWSTDNKGRSNKTTLSGATLTYGSTTITETDGLEFTTSAANQIALLFDLGSTDIGTYNGSKYIWLYGKNSQITIPDVPAGATVTIGIESHKTSESRQMNVSNASPANASVSTYEEKSFTVSADGDVTISPNGSGMHIYSIAVTANVETVPVKTNASRNYGTMVTPAGKKLDFSAVADDVKAYISPGLNDGKTAISIQSVGKVPENTPIIIKTTTQGATVNVPVTTEAADDIASINKLVAGDGSTDATPATYTYFYIAGDQFHKATSGTLKSGKAYLKLLTSELSGHELSLGFEESESDGEATGVASVGKPQTTTSQEVYNLAGQRVAQPTKGLYIVNGKKVLVK